MEPFKTQTITADLKIGLEKTCGWTANKSWVCKNVCVFPPHVKRKWRLILCKTWPQIFSYIIVCFHTVLSHKPRFHCLLQFYLPSMLSSPTISGNIYFSFVLNLTYLPLYSLNSLWHFPSPSERCGKTAVVDGTCHVFMVMVSWSTSWFINITSRNIILWKKIKKQEQNRTTTTTTTTKNFWKYLWSVTSWSFSFYSIIFPLIVLQFWSFIRYFSYSL